MNAGLDVKACPGQVKILKSQFGQVILTLYLPADREGKHLQCDWYSIAKTHQQLGLHTFKDEAVQYQYRYQRNGTVF